MSQRNTEFYSQDIVLRVENELFKISKFLLIHHSQTFRTMFNMPIPQPEGVEPDGSSDDQPLILEGIEKKDFIALLRCLNPQFQTAPGNGFSLDQWKSVLKLSNLYEMDEVKNLAVECMTPLLKAESPSLQIHLAQVHDVLQWLKPAKARLVDRNDSIDETDVQLTGLKLALEVCALRENALLEKMSQEKTLRENEQREHAQREKLLREELLQEKALRESERRESEQRENAQRVELFKEILQLKSKQIRPKKPTKKVRIEWK